MVPSRPQTARICAFPLLFFWLCIPLPSFQQATVELQIIATQFGHLGGSLFGVDTYLQGTNIRSTEGHWDAFNIAGGCSGMRSLMALIMLSAAWAYLSDLKFWKKCVLFLSAIPLAVIGNGVRIASIVVMAEYGDARGLRPKPGTTGRACFSFSPSACWGWPASIPCWPGK